MTIRTDLQTLASRIEDDSTLALGGMTLYRRPVAFTRALLSRASRPKNLTLLNFTAGFESDLLVGSGCVDAVRSVYFGLEAFGLAPMFTAKASNNGVKIIEETEASIVAGLRATTNGVGFIPSHAWINTDLPEIRRDVKTIKDPYTGETFTAFPAINVDTVVIHGLAVDSSGNVLINNNLGIDLELIYAANQVIATVEVAVDRLTKSTQGVIIPSPGIDYVAVVPHGAHPTSCFPEYSVDGQFLLSYVEACNGGKFEIFLKDYLEK